MQKQLGVGDTVSKNRNPPKSLLPNSILSSSGRLVLSPGTAELESQGQSCGCGVKIFMINNLRKGRLVFVHDVRGFRSSW